jgi:hypothetical protein
MRQPGKVVRITPPRVPVLAPSQLAQDADVSVDVNAPGLRFEFAPLSEYPDVLLSIARVRELLDDAIAASEVQFV